MPTAIDGLSSRVLIVDPDPLFSRILTTRLERLGYRVQCETSGAAAIEWCRADAFRIVITEMELTDADGIALSQAIRGLSRPNYTYIMIYTGRQDKDACMQALAAGADDYLTKPFNALEFRLRLSNAERLLTLDDERTNGGMHPVTHLIGRNVFLAFLRASLAEKQRNGDTGELLFFTITNYQDIFRRNGYDASMALESAVASRLRQVLRLGDLLAHIDAGEFCCPLTARNNDGSFAEAETSKACQIAGIVLQRAGSVAVSTQGTRLMARIDASSITFPLGTQTAEQILVAPERRRCRQAPPISVTRALDPD
ncbi:MAG: response regulator [Alphaproteobacteria bacterium]